MTFPPSTISSPHASMSTTSPSIRIPPSTPPTMFLSPIIYQPRPHHLVVDIVTSIQWTLDSQSWTGQKLCLLKSSPSYGTSIPKVPKGLFLCLFSDFESLLMICFRRLEIVIGCSEYKYVMLCEYITVVFFTYSVLYFRSYTYKKYKLRFNIDKRKAKCIQKQLLALE